MKTTQFFALCAMLLAALTATGSAFAQGGGGGGNTGGGNFGGGGTTGGGNTGGFNTGGFNTGGATTGGTNFGGTTGGTTGQSTGGTSGGNATNNSQPLNLNNQLNITPTTPPAIDERNQGFIGPNAQQLIEQGFVGASTQLSGAQPVAGTSFGGGVNTQGSGGGGARAGGGGIGGAQGLRAAGAAGMGRNALGGFGGNTAGVRRNVRNRLVNQVQVNRVPPAEVAQRFSTRLDRIPLVAGVATGVEIAVENGTAVLTGTVPSVEAANKLERQLRLEPGVYRIDNRLEIDR